MEELLRLIHNVTQVHTGMHFVYTGNAHGDGYVNYRALKEPQNRYLLKRTSIALLSKVAAETDLDPNKPIVVVGPETLGALMVTALEEHFDGLSLQLSALILKKGEGEKEFLWDKDPSGVIKPDSQIIWLDDLLNAASTLKATKPMIESLGAKIHTVAVIGDRSKKTVQELGVGNLIYLEKFDLTKYDLSKGPCVPCQENVPIVRNPGHGHRYELEHPDYPGGYTDL